MNSTLNIDNKKSLLPSKRHVPCTIRHSSKKKSIKINTMKSDETSSKKRVMYNGL